MRSSPPTTAAVTWCEGARVASRVHEPSTYVSASSRGITASRAVTASSPVMASERVTSSPGWPEAPVRVMVLAAWMPAATAAIHIASINLFIL